MLLGELSYPATVAVCLSHKFIISAHMMSLSCFLFIRMLYIHSFSFTNTISDRSLVTAIKVFSLGSSLVANVAESAYK